MRGKEMEDLKRRLVQSIFKSEKSPLWVFFFFFALTKLMETCDFLKCYTL